MGWLGKIIGGTLGFFLGGPLGLIAGAVFGHMIDKSSEFEESNDSQDYQRTQNDGSNYSQNDYSRRFFFNTGYGRSQMVFFVGAFSMLAKLASADGTVSENAKRKVSEFMVNDLHLAGQSYYNAVNIFNNALEQSITFESLADQFYSNFRNSPSILQLMIDIFYRVANADGVVSKNEERLIEYAARRFQIPQSVLDSIKRRYGVSSTPSKAYAVLGLTESATEAEIKKAYRKLILEFHPDTVAAKGMADEFKEYATKKFREIQEAYELICKEREIK